MGSDKDRLAAIQSLRAVAALMVVLHHARNPIPWLWNPLAHYEAFASGVDIFFVISGLIMYVAARDERWREFIGKRVIRVVPLYWIATLALLAIELLRHQARLDATELWHMLQSLLFIPHPSPDKHGELYPLLAVGWTLNYEMFFYALFCVGIVLRRVVAVPTVLILALVAAGALGEPQGPLARTYTSPLLLEFLCGLWLGVLYRRGHADRLPGWLLPAGLAGLLLLPALPEEGLALADRIVCGVAVVAGAIGLGTRAPRHPLLERLGDASYSIYLTHTVLALLLVQALWARIPLHGPLQLAGYLLTALGVSALVGLASYRWLECPITRGLRRAWMERGARRKAASVEEAAETR
ncbi:acyltransferase [Pseudoxanthomonas winnipegensis]|jgi:exopolysaccharide production protein ExoZ|uniref:Acyltransferase n=1 Tax=Pseudoxanthomonas winnipegensis TaxID=2480810 RepID=A0ABY1W8W9_9GAMM|nr:acyltransferase [Pseudoxanthomonas winnipegensis]TAA06052.1 acyltransferase [Pseudoxanthomonas winnipegensis]TAA16198.1 acyltransferase [Pseudoxanthomonas winnipegensis]TAH71425.1 acyltransferase [Pseudoxanthomonas winnipegensis]